MKNIVKGLLFSLILVGGGLSFAASSATTTNAAWKVCKTCADGFRPEQ
ncbi:hypothetical protein BH24DEI2_BH24DEI2_27480 [soil metagenome]